MTVSHRIWHHFLYDPEPVWEREALENEARALEDEGRGDRESELPDFEKEATP